MHVATSGAIPFTVARADGTIPSPRSVAGSFLQMRDLV
jgi:hypothetical protein